MKLLKLVPDHTNLDFVRWRNLALALSLIATAASIAFTAYRGLNLGIDFVGGQVVRVEFPQPVKIDDLRAKVAQLNVGEAGITTLGNARTYQVRLPKPEGPESASNQVVSKLRAALPKDYPGARVDAGESVSGKVSEELAQDSAMAISFAMLGIALYIWFRFEWQFGVGALLTLAHDVAMTLGFFAFTRLIALGVLMLIGPEVIFGLAIAIFLGVVIGTYSSIYISSPVLVWLGVEPDSFLKTDDKDEAAPQTA